LDESVPRLVKTKLSRFDVKTVQEMGWTGIKNGELVAKAEGKFDVFITADKNMRYQQNLSKRKLAIIVLPTNRVPEVAGLVPAIAAAIEAVRAGTFLEIKSPDGKF
jgi:hypothetical protein